MSEQKDNILKDLEIDPDDIEDIDVNEESRDEDNYEVGDKAKNHEDDKGKDKDKFKDTDSVEIRNGFAYFDKKHTLNPMIHRCTVDRDENLFPIKDSGCQSRTVVCLRETVLASKDNAVYSHYFRSNAAIRSERKRQASLPYWFIIHPFSDFRMYWEGFMTIVYTFAFFFIPFESANIFFHQLNPDNFIDYGPTVFILHTLFFFEIMLNFLTGYCVKQTKMVVLEPKKIIRKYLKGFFIIDVLASVSAVTNAYFIYYLNTDTKQPLSKYLVLLYYLKGFRIITHTQYSDRIAEKYGVNDLFYRILKILYRSAIFFHAGACLNLVIPFQNPWQIIGANSGNAWINLIKYDLGTTSLVNMYLACLTHVISLSLACAVTRRTQTVADFILAIVCALIGIMYCGFLFVELLDLIRSKFEPETKYDEFITQLRDYMRHNQLPMHIQQRLFLFYEYRYQKTYFKEGAIMSTLSERLRKEISSYGCKRMIRSVFLFGYLDEDILTEIGSKLKPQVYLPKDKIIKAGSTGNCMFFISYGTVAVYTLSGKEVCHLHDGDYFGEIALLMKDHKRIATVIAAEICEVYVLDREVFSHTLGTNPEIYAKMLHTAKIRMKETKALETQFRKSFDKEEEDFEKIISAPSVTNFHYN